jgi:uncharacterized protein (TIGR02594 family)
MLPRKYEYLSREGGPKMLVEALRLHGTRETAGPGNTPEIMAWAHEMGGDLARVFTADAIPWCGLFMAIVAKRAGKPGCAQPLWARAWASWGQASPRASLGDVLVFVRRGGGHVGLYVGDDGTHYHVLGGNQGNAVSIIRIAKARCIAVRRFYRIAPPANVRPIRLAASGPVSTNEA